MAAANKDIILIALGSPKPGLWSNPKITTISPRGEASTVDQAKAYLSDGKGEVHRSESFQTFQALSDDDYATIVGTGSSKVAEGGFQDTGKVVNDRQVWALRQDVTFRELAAKKEFGGVIVVACQKQ